MDNASPKALGEIPVPETLSRTNRPLLAGVGTVMVDRGRKIDTDDDVEGKAVAVAGVAAAVAAAGGGANKAESPVKAGSDGGTDDRTLLLRHLDNFDGSCLAKVDPSDDNSSSS